MTLTTPMTSVRITQNVDRVLPVWRLLGWVNMILPLSEDSVTVCAVHFACEFYLRLSAYFSIY